MDQYTLNEAFDDEGFSFTKLQKNKFIIIGALPSETVTATFLGRKTKEHYYLIDEVRSPHPKRITPKCKEVPRCGGCIAQNLDYTAQLEYKNLKIKKLFPEDHDKIKTIIPSPVLFHYRAKMDFSFSQNKAGEKFLGLTQAKGSGRVINISTCFLAPSWMSEALNLLQKAFQSSHLCAYDRKGQGDLKNVMLREGKNTQEKMVILEVAAHKDSHLHKPDLKPFFDPLIERFGKDLSIYLRIVQMIPGTPTQVYEMHLHGKEHIREKLNIDGKELTFKISPSAFFQPNPSTAEILLNTLVEIVKPLKVDTLIDLFCGTGTISLCLAPYVKKVIGVEINPYAVFDALENKEINGLEYCEFIKQDAGEFVKTTDVKPDLVTVDPPRAGLGEKAARWLLELNPKYILYVSCNPKTQSIDQVIIKNAGYEIELIQPLDQFPHTAHIENIILFKKINNS